MTCLDVLMACGNIVMFFHLFKITKQSITAGTCEVVINELLNQFLLLMP
jgi:hypothetical protein